MKKGIVVSTIIVVLVMGIAVTYISNTKIDKEDNNPVNVSDENKVDNTNKEVEVIDKIKTNDYVNDTVEIKDSSYLINTEVKEVIESDKETGAETIVNTDGDVVVTNDKALAIAEENSKEDDNSLLEEDDDEVVVINSIDDFIKLCSIEEPETTETKKNDTKKNETTSTKKDNNVKSETTTTKKNETVKSDTTSTKKNDTNKIDQATIDLFKEMGWGEPTLDHSRGNVDTSEGSVMEGKTKGNPFITP